MTNEKDVKAEIAASPGAELPGTFSNRFYFIVSPDTTRIVFAEGAGGVILNHHTAIVMPTSDAEDLAKRLNEAIKSTRKAEAAMKAKPNG